MTQSALLVSPGRRGWPICGIGLQTDSANFAIRLRPQCATGDADSVEDAEVVMLDFDFLAAPRRRESPRVHAQQAFNQRVAAGLLGNVADHRIERILGAERGMSAPGKVRPDVAQSRW